ncbi:MAG: AMP-binding protein [Zoogloeaceae bacterium]|jgi:fatty-acyl-CoA synthase|nr:AMP-binding protein [Zoogloeaceae bacterium]
MNPESIPDDGRVVWRNRRFYDAIHWAAETFAEAEALVDRETRLSFWELRESVRQFARALLALGVSPGDHVALWMDDCADWYVARWAIPAIGAVLAPVNTRFRAHDLGYVLKQSDARALIVGSGAQGVDYLAILAQVAPGWFTKAGNDPGLPLLKTVFAFENEAFPLPANLPASITPGSRLAGLAATVVESRLDEAIAAVRPDSVAQILYTSGTTSFPKGAMLCHGQLLQNNFNTIARMRFTPKDRFLMSAPLFSATGTSYALSILLSGAAMVLMGRFSPERFCRLVEEEGITAAFFVDAIVNDLKHFAKRGRYNLSSLRTGTGVPLSPDSFAFATHDLGIPGLIGVYGMSEVSNAATRGSCEEPYEIRARANGRPVPDVEVRVVDVETGETLPEGEIGEIRVRGYTVTRGYYRQPEENARAFDAEGWFRTGDLGRLAGEQLVFCGRMKEMIKPGGFNVSTLEIETFLKEYEGVREAVVVGVPDERLGEVAYAFIEPESGVSLDAQRLLAFCRENIAAYKRPRHVEFVTDWPRTGSQKIRKIELKAQAQRRVAEGRETPAALS